MTCDVDHHPDSGSDAAVFSNQISKRASLIQPSGSPLLKCIDAEQLRQADVRWHPAHFTIRPFCPFPTRIGTDQPGARAAILETRSGSKDVDHRPRTAWTILVQVGKGIEDWNLIDDGKACSAGPCRSSIHSTCGQAKSGTSDQGTPADVRSVGVFITKKPPSVIFRGG
jgi:hypothetical protein